MRPGITEPNDVSADLVAVAGARGRQAAAENFPVALRLLPADGPRTSWPGSTRSPASSTTSVTRRPATGSRTAGRRRGARCSASDAARRRRSPGRRPGAGRRGRRPGRPFLDLVAANRQDQRATRYATFDDLLEYCRLSAAPVGRIVLHLAGAADPANCRRLRRGLQRPAGARALPGRRRGRPRRPGLPAGRRPAGRRRAPTTTLTGSATDARRCARSWRVQVERSASCCAPGRPLVRRLRGWARLAVAGYVAGGLATADALRRADFDVLAPRRPSRQGAHRVRTPLRLLMAGRG